MSSERENAKDEPTREERSDSPTERDLERVLEISAGLAEEASRGTGEDREAGALDPEFEARETAPPERRQPDRLEPICLNTHGWPSYAVNVCCNKCGETASASPEACLCGDRKGASEECEFEVVLAAIKADFREAFLDEKNLEIRVTGWANSSAVTVPAPTSAFTIRSHHTFISVGAVILRLSLRRGEQRIVRVRADATEVEITGGGRPEWGSSDPPHQLSLKCGTAPATLVSVPVKRKNGREVGTVYVRFEANQLSS